MKVLADEELVQLCLQGDRAAFAEIVNRYEKQIFSLAYRLTNNVEDAQDLAQEVFIKLYQVLDKFDGQRNFFPWMYKVATNVCYTALRRKPQQNVPLEKVIEFAPLIPKSDSQPEEYTEKREMQQLVQKAIAQLPENYRLPIVLRYLEEMSYQQIADAMGLPLSTIETRLFRGRSLLKQRLSLLMEGREKKRELSGS